MAKNDHKESYADIPNERWQSAFGNKKYQYEKCPKCNAEITFDRITMPNTYLIKVIKKCSKCDWIGEVFYDETKELNNG